MNSPRIESLSISHTLWKKKIKLSLALYPKIIYFNIFTDRIFNSSHRPSTRELWEYSQLFQTLYCTFTDRTCTCIILQSVSSVQTTLVFTCYLLCFQIYYNLSQTYLFQNMFEVWSDVSKLKGVFTNKYWTFQVNREISKYL